jgi:hypothetical protein
VLANYRLAVPGLNRSLGEAPERHHVGANEASKRMPPAYAALVNGRIFASLRFGGRIAILKTPPSALPPADDVALTSLLLEKPASNMFW